MYKKRIGLSAVQCPKCSTSECCVFLSEVSVFAMMNEYFPFFRNHCLVVNEPVDVDCGKNIHKIVIYVWIVEVCQGLFYLKIAYPFALFFLLTK